MSRICVKNLPKYVAEDRLRDLFSQKGEITDAKLMRTKDGKSRQFAFIGFRTEHEAEEAIGFFNKSFIDTCKITCEIARKVGDPDIPRPWSRHSLAKEKKVTENDNKNDRVEGSSLGHAKVELIANKKSNENDGLLLQEFLQVMQPRVKSKLWENDLVVDPEANQNIKDGKKKTQKMEGGKEKSDSGKLELNQDVSHSDKPHNLALDEVVSDMDYFKSRVKKEWSDSESSDDEDSGSDETSNLSQESHEIKEDKERDLNEEHGEISNIDGEVNTLSEDPNGEIHDPEKSEPVLDDEEDENLESSRLFVRNLPFTATEEELQEHFSMFGDVSQVHLVVDKETKRSKGFAYIQYALPESASRALEELDHSIFQGRLLHIMHAKQKVSSKRTDVSTSQASKTFKQKKQEERKAAEASGDTRAWNAMFMRPDTVVENMSRMLGVSKTDLLDREADDIAVRIALGEAQVTAETKKTLANAGVNVKCLEDFANGNTHGLKRSNHILLAKNLPYGCSEGELAKMFGKFGSLDKIILPPTKTLALVIFLEPSEARAAFRGLAYKRYKDAPLYLEWAPADVLDGTPSSKGEEKDNDVHHEQFANASLAASLEADIDPDRVESRSLFVKNLNFKTSDESLKEHLSRHIKEGKISSVKIKKHLKNGKNVSMGFGFIEFDSVDTAINACKDLQGNVLDGHALILQVCHAKKEQVVKKVDKDKSSTKLLVRNVAFEATKKELRQLFSPFGQIKSLRLPMKFGNHRGFAFVEFVTKQEAQNALEALSNTHLYGRHLVLERAKEGETLEELRARTTAQFTDEQNGYQNSTKLSKKRKQVAVLDEGSMKFKRVEE